MMIIDNFYPNPDEAREYALSLPFDVKGNFPGARTKSYLPNFLKDQLQSCISPVGKISNWYEDQYTGCFQITTARDRTWIHCDFENWAAVCYLTPNAPSTGGTGFFRNKITGARSKRDLSCDDEWLKNPAYDGYDYTKWELTDNIANKYNRLILYRADMFHASLDYFGQNIRDGRLFQVFFFDTTQ